MAGVPGLTSAASDTSSETTADVAAIVVEQDGSTTPFDGEARPEPGERLRETLQALVDDGTLTAAQADAVTEHLVENRPEREGRHHRRGRRPGADGEVVAEIIGIDVDTLREELRSGSSLADIATANGVDPQTVIDALVDAAEEHLDLAVQNGRLTEEEAADKAEQIEERVTARVNGERPERPQGPGPDADPDV